MDHFFAQLRQLDPKVWVATGLSVLIVPIILSYFSHHFDYRNKHILITGGSSGIGLEVAKEYLRRGAHVTIIARDQKKLDSAQVELESIALSKKLRVLTKSIDTSDFESVKNGLTPILSQHGDIDVLVNCVGTSIAAEFQDLKPSDFERMMRINYLGSIFPTQVVLPGMKAKRSGRIVFVASQVAQVAIHGYTAYAGSKWALRGLAEALQMEVRPFGVLVSVSYPPDTDTPGYKEEMLTKPPLTRLLSQSGSLFSAQQVARDLVEGSSRGYFSLTSGLDGWLLAQLHPGMSPVNNWVEALQPLIFAPLARAIAFFYVKGWEGEARKYEASRQGK